MQFHPLVVKLPKFRLEEHHTHTPPSTPLFSSPQALVPTDFRVVAGSAPPSESKHTDGIPLYSSRSTTMRLQPPGKMRQTLEEGVKKHGKGVAPKGGIKQRNKNYLVGPTAPYKEYRLHQPTIIQLNIP